MLRKGHGLAGEPTSLPGCDAQQLPGQQEETSDLGRVLIFQFRPLLATGHRGP